MGSNYNCKYVSTEKLLTSTFGKIILNICVSNSMSIISLPYMFDFSFSAFTPRIPLDIHSVRHIMFK